MARHIAHYTLVRLLPQSDSGEFANMGVVVACPALGFFDFRLITRYRRITQFFEEFNRELFTQVRKPSWPICRTTCTSGSSPADAGKRRWRCGWCRISCSLGRP